MGDFGEGKWVLARKRHKCAGCGWRIPKGERHYHYNGRYRDEWQDWRLHAECFAVFETFDEPEFMPGEIDPPQRIVTLAALEVARG